MTRDEAKELLPVIKAFAEGKEIEYYAFDGNIGEWNALGDKANFDGEPRCYRIKPEPKYRPFKTMEECWQEMQKHQPFGWLKTEGDKWSIYRVDIDGVLIGDSSFYSFNNAIKYFTFVDGTPFGVKEK